MGQAAVYGPYITICKNCGFNFSETGLTPEARSGDFCCAGCESRYNSSDDFCCARCESRYNSSDDYLDLMFDDEMGGEA